MQRTTGKRKRQPAAYQCSVCFRVRRKQSAVDEWVEAVMIERLSRPDALREAAKHDDAKGEIKTLRKQLRAFDVKLNEAAGQFAADDITGEQLKRITADVRKRRTDVERQLEVLTSRNAFSRLTGDDVATKWAAAPLELKRDAIDTFVTVTIMPSGPGKSFDPALVRIEPKDVTHTG